MKTLLLLVLVGCSTKLPFTNGEDNFKASGTLQVHGYKSTGDAARICNGNNQLAAEYFIQLRGPKSGEKESDYKQYVKAESNRAQLCAVVGLWCSSAIYSDCRLDDEGCVAKAKSWNQRQNSCYRRITPVRWRKDFAGVYPGKINGAIECFDHYDQDGYTSPLAELLFTRMALTVSSADLEKECLARKTLEECQDILGDFGSVSRLGQPTGDIRKLAEMLVKRSPEVVLNDGYVQAKAQIDFTTFCKFIEPRH